MFVNHHILKTRLSTSNGFFITPLFVLNQNILTKQKIKK